MAEIQNQILARLPTNQVSNVTLVFDNEKLEFNLAAKRIFGRKAVERRFFRSKNAAGETSWFECSPALGDNIMGQLSEFIFMSGDNAEHLKELNVVISREDRTSAKHNVSVISEPKALPKISVFRQFTDWFRSIIG